MKALFATVLGVAVLGLAKVQAQDTEKLVGKWEITKSAGEAPVGTVVEFTKDGKISAVVKLEKEEIKIEGTYKLEKDKLMLKLKVGDMTSEDVLTVKKLTDEELELEDKDKKVDVLKKLKK